MSDARVGDRLRRWFDDTLWGPETAARLLVVHAGLAALIGARIALGSYRQLADTPSALVDPVPFLFWLDRMPSVPVIVGLQVLGVAAAVVAVVALVRPRDVLGVGVVRLAYAVAWLCYLALAGLRGSRGKVLHNDLLLLWAAVPFLLAPVVSGVGALGDRAARVRRRAHGWPIRVATVVIVLVYFFAGYHKLRRSGIDWVTGDNMRYVMVWGPAIGQPGWEGLTRWIGEHIWAARATAAFILGMEVTFPLALVWRRLQPWYAAAAVFLHIMTWFVLGLDYWAWALTVPLVLVDWPAVVASWSGWARGRAPSPTRTAEGAVR